jgi:hypothetical protein
MIGHNNISHHPVIIFIQRVEPFIDSIIRIGNTEKVSPLVTSESDKVNAV